MRDACLLSETSPFTFTHHARAPPLTSSSEPLRPEWQDVEPLVENLDAIPETAFWRRSWYELPEKHTESWYVREALKGTWPDEPAYRLISLICRPNLDIYRGFAGQYTRRYGNLRRDGVDEVLNQAVAEGASSDDEIWFTREQLLPVQDVAAGFGHPDSQRIHMHPVSIRRWWLECARRAGPISHYERITCTSCFTVTCEGEQPERAGVLLGKI